MYRYAAANTQQFYGYQPMAERIPTDESANKLVTYLLETGLSGFPPLSSAESLATEYLIDQDYQSDDARVDSLIKWEMTKNFTTGFITGLGGIVTMPVGVPSALGASWLIQARMAGAIARIYGHTLDEDRVRTMILLSLAGDVAKDAMADLGLDLGGKFGGKLPGQAIRHMPGRALVEVNKRIGFQLLTKAGGRSIAQFPKVIPVVGGVVGGVFDAAVCRMVGRTAKSLFRPVASS
jgi:uncharacterized protein (DUF697 family)